MLGRTFDRSQIKIRVSLPSFHGAPEHEDVGQSAGAVGPSRPRSRSAAAGADGGRGVAVQGGAPGVREEAEAADQDSRGDANTPGTADDSY